MKRKTNVVRINMEPWEFTIAYSGIVNDEKFYLIHNKNFDIYTEEPLLTVQIIWENSKVENRDTLEKGIRQLFKKKIEENYGKDN